MPAIAASTCSQAPASRQISEIAAVGSNASDDVVPRVAHTKNGVRPAARSAAIAVGERIGSHRVGGVVGDRADRLRPDAGDAQRLLDTRMGVRRGIGDEVRRVAIGVDGTAGRPPPCREHGDQRRLARRPLDHAAAALARVAPARRQGEELGHPVDDAQFELGARRRRHPAHPVDTEARRQQLAEDRRVRGVGREVGEEVRVLPVHQPRHHDAIDVGEHVGEGFGIRRRVFGQLGQDVAGFDVGCDRTALDGVEVVGHPVDQPVTCQAELLRRHRRQCGRAKASRSAGRGDEHRRPRGLRWRRGRRRRQRGRDPGANRHARGCRTRVAAGR